MWDFKKNARFSRIETEKTYLFLDEIKSSKSTVFWPLFDHFFQIPQWYLPRANDKHFRANGMTPPQLVEHLR